MQIAITFINFAKQQNNSIQAELQQKIIIKTNLNKKLLNKNTFRRMCCVLTVESRSTDFSSVLLLLYSVKSFAYHSTHYKNIIKFL